MLFILFHFAEAAANLLTNDALDPQAKIPEFKACAVQVEKARIRQLQELLRKEKVRVVDAPRVANPDDPSFPKRSVQLVLGAILAIMLALAAGLVAELWSDHGIRSGKDLAGT